VVDSTRPIYVFVDGEDIMISSDEYDALQKAGLLSPTSDINLVPEWSGNNFVVTPENAQRFWEVLSDFDEGLTEGV
jgi:dipeptidase